MEDEKPESSSHTRKQNKIKQNKSVGKAEMLTKWKYCFNQRRECAWIAYNDKINVIYIDK